MGEAERVLAFMPASQGVMHWPPEGAGLVSLVEETDLPLPDYSIDRVLLAHGLENADSLRALLREIWRVLTGDGRVLVVVPNRRGLWARSDRTPLGGAIPTAPPSFPACCATICSRRHAPSGRSTCRRSATTPSCARPPPGSAWARASFPPSPAW